MVVTIDGQREKTFREVQDGVVKCYTFNEEYLGFGPISSRSAGRGSSSTDHHKVEQMGTITVEVYSCKKTRTVEVENSSIPPWNNRSSAVEEHSEEINNLEMQGTK